MRHPIQRDYLAGHPPLARGCLAHIHLTVIEAHILANVIAGKQKESLARKKSHWQAEGHTCRSAAHRQVVGKASSTAHHTEAIYMYVALRAACQEEQVI